MALTPKHGPQGRAMPLLLIKLVAANIVVAGVVAVVLYITFDGLTEVYFERLMKEFNISPTKLNSMFVDDVEKSLFWGIGIALVVGVGLSLLLTNAVLRPLRKMARASETIAAGDFSARAPEMTGELGTLARSFNVMAKTLEDEEARRRQLLRDLSHEIRTPLTNLRGYLEALNDGIFEAGPDVFGVLHGEAVRLNALVDDLSTLAAAEAVDERLEFEAVDLEDAVRSAAAAHRHALMERGIELEINTQGKPTPVKADPKRLHQVLNNALANLVQYSQCPPAGDAGSTRASVRLDFSKAGYAEMRFENPSTNIGVEDIDRLFDRFYRADPARADDPRGGTHHAGLGLAIIKRLVEAHSGSVRAEQADGRFRLIVTLPLKR
jgi:two-component system, OmpR family, sensor histidine kinase BaeS